MQNKNVIVGVTGGIAAYKSAELIRRLREAGASVQVVMTAAAKEFITPLTLQALSGHPVHADLLNIHAEAAMGHIELARWADVVLIAPASADFIAKLAYGHANDLLSTLCLATKAPLIVAPAMNQQMWHEKITQRNITKLKNQDVQIIGPSCGSQACGDVGFGRLLEPNDIIDFLRQFLQQGFLERQHVLITAGATREYLDPARYITNISSGKMGYALAAAAVEAGAVVTLVTGRTALKIPAHVNAVQVETTQQMLDAVIKDISQTQIFIAAAAVCDYRPATYSPKKISKDKTSFQLKLIRNPDILKTVSDYSLSSRGALHSKATWQFPVNTCRPFIVGFAAQTENLLKHAKEKFKRKSCDMLVANQVGLADRGFESDHNAATVIWNKGKQAFPLMSKTLLARKLIKLIAEHYYAKHTIKNS
jgi:phosphopantothenoylcysteine decarboxylase/phosphopantothenate--cysteine ligase